MTTPPETADWKRAYTGKRVLVTGHTGFKGSWLTAWLASLGADVFGFALAPPTTPSLFEAIDVASSCRHRVADIRDAQAIARAVSDADPDFVFHLAAQPLVRASYERPIETIEVNVLGTAHLLEALRVARANAAKRCAVVVVTSDKCYENDDARRNGIVAFRETDPMGGHDVYSMSKGAAELVLASYRRSFFSSSRIGEHGVAIASARAGNVIGGGDWAVDRIVPDAARALARGEPIVVRNPHAVRPWQHVLEPLGGYLLLGARLATAADPAAYCDAWNFGPSIDGACTVRALVERTVAAWGGGTWEDRSDPRAPHEAAALRLAIDKAGATLGWRPRWSFDETVARTVAWYRAHAGGAGSAELRALTAAQIREYSG